MSPAHHNDDSDAELDRLLARADWPEPTPQQLLRLRGRWHSLKMGRSRVRVVATIMSIAASLLVIGGWIALRQGNNRDQQLVVRPEESAAMTAQPTADAPGAVREGAEALVQSPTLYERVALIERMPVHQQARRTETARATRRIRGRALMAQRKLGQQTLEQNAWLAEACRQAGSILARAMTSRNQAFDRWQVASVAALTRATAEIEHAATLARESSPHGQLVLAVAGRGSVSEVAAALRNERDRDFRRRLLVELVSRGTTESVTTYLDFVANPVSRGEALAALADVPRLPGATLLAQLRNPRVAHRYAAALVLARTSDATVIDALAASLDDVGSRQQALVALLLNPAPRAAAIVNEARADLNLVASVRAAEVDLSRLIVSHSR